MVNPVSDANAKAAEKISVVAVDVDGTLTDGGMYYFDDDSEAKKFNVRDGSGVALLKQVGVAVVFISGESHTSIQRRADKLQVDACFTGVRNKVATMLDWLKQRGLTFDELAFVGDEINDLPLLRSAALSFAPRDANPLVQREVDVVVSARGGEGTLRDVAIQILGWQECLDQALDGYLADRS